MNTYFVTYTLDDQSSYPALSKLLTRFPNWVKLFARTWIIKSSLSSKRVRDKLIDAIDGNGQIVVINITDSAWATYRINEDILNWMKENI